MLPEPPWHLGQRPPQVLGGTGGGQRALGVILSCRDLEPTPLLASLLLRVPSAPPAVDDNGPSVGRGGGFHTPDEGQQPRGVVGDAVLRPGREVELADLVPGRVAPLGRQQ